MNNIYINIKDVAEAKGLKSTRSLRLELNKSESKYISREVQVNGGISYEILFSSLGEYIISKSSKAVLDMFNSKSVGFSSLASKKPHLKSFVFTITPIVLHLHFA